MFKKGKYLFAFIIPASTILDFYTCIGQGWFMPVVAFVIIPLIEHFIPVDASNTEEGNSFWYDLLLYLNGPLLFGIVGYWLVQSAEVHLPWYAWLGYTVSTGIVAGVTGINVAHELGHRQKQWEQYLGMLMLVPSFYCHWQDVHNRGHHKLVGTPEDATTARKGEWIYLFWLRSILGTWKEGFRLYQKDKKLGRPSPPFLISCLCMSIYLIGLILIGGIPILLTSIFIAVVSVTLLESVNYIEHYGLFRKKTVVGTYERVQPIHSWNSDHVLGRIVLYELTRHSDHHYKASTHYQNLRRLPESPQLPTGYPGSILCALIPPLWFHIMDRRIPKNI